MITHDKIATLAGVSASTVSKALSGSKEISEAATQRILDIVAQNDYFRQKKIVKRENSKHYTETIAIICPEIISIHYSAIVTMLNQEIESRGGRVLVLINDFRDEKRQNIIKYMNTSNMVDGIILLDAKRDAITSAIPVIHIGCCHDGAQDSVGFDMYSAIDKAVDYLIKAGHSHIGFVGENYTLLKSEAFKKSIYSHRLPLKDEDLIVINKRFYEIGIDAAKIIISTDDKPTAIISAYDEIAISLMYEFQRSGIRVPQDISVIGINDIPDAQYASPPLTTIKTFWNEQCQSVVELLYKKITGEAQSHQTIILKSELILRESTAAVTNHV